MGRREYALLTDSGARLLAEEETRDWLPENPEPAYCIPSAEILEGLGIQDGAAEMMDLLLDERLVAGGIIVERELLRECGGVNWRLPAKRVYELSIRVAEAVSVRVADAGLAIVAGEMLVCRSDGDGAGRGAGQVLPTDNALADAYVIGRHYASLRERGLLEEVVGAFLETYGGCPELGEGGARVLLEEMVSHTGRYRLFYGATLPILIYLSSDFCYNVLNVFAREMGAALKRLGRRVEYYDTKREDAAGLARLACREYYSSIVFQAWLFSVPRADGESRMQDLVGGPKYNFLVDHPIWLDSQLRGAPRDYYALTHDRNYIAFIEKYYPRVFGTYLLPPGGRRELAAYPIHGAGRDLDLVFLGTYNDYRRRVEEFYDCGPDVRHLAAAYLCTMRQDPSIPPERAFEQTLIQRGIELGDDDFLALFGEMKPVFQCAMFYYREKVIDALLQAGIPIHVYGSSWDDAPFRENPCLIRHDALPAEQAGEALGRAKLSLNVMAWHKDGFTERIADGMLAGAVVVSDVTSQLERDWADEAALFDLKHLDSLPSLVRGLLADVGRREAIAARAREKALRHATWDVRAREFLTIIESWQPKTM